ncbi:DNA polymerase III subunit beta [Desulfotomaculum copahuensis]|uniref:Beta sliding clamp n=1 Tax=Desulfotomaculum copahuensis TaxID=1838280 RepID=A0A1B7LBN7_9FIRM|nr:DNA polymerase III subunit beta [Desulfotomaculum copahuensis]OAT79888.1 DNA polymerase III subunit beta [Desulfotomaculum copahuensis]
MKFSATKSTLVYALQIVQKAVSPRNPVPTLSGILFKTGADQLTVSATDLDLTIECTVPVTVHEPGNIVLPARYITELARRLPDVPILIETLTAGSAATISYGQSQSNIHGFPADQYPELPELPEAPALLISQGKLKEVIRQVIFAASTDETRPVFTGALLEIRDGALTLVATDTHRLAWCRLPVQADEIISIIVPGKTFTEMLKITGNSEEEDVTVYVSQSHVFFVTSVMQISSRVIAGKFPPYQQVIPREFSTRIKAVTRELLEATERASLLITEGMPVVHFNLEKDACVLSVHTEAGWIREEMDLQVEGEPLQISFNSRYLCDALRAINSNEVLINMTGPLSAAVIRCPENTQYLSLLLPAQPKPARSE